MISQIEYIAASFMAILFLLASQGQVGWVGNHMQQKTSLFLFELAGH